MLIADQVQTRREKIAVEAVPKCEHQHTAGHSVKSVPDCDTGWATQEYAKHTESPESDRSDPSTMLHMRVKHAGQTFQGTKCIKQEYTRDRQQLACTCLQQTAERTCHLCVISSYNVIKKTVIGKL